MTTPDSPDLPDPAKEPETADLVADIEATREELGRTVDELGSRLDVKTQARAQVDDVRARVTSAVTDERGNPTTAAKAVAAAVVAVVVGVVVASVVRRRRES